MTTVKKEVKKMANRRKKTQMHHNKTTHYKFLTRINKIISNVPRVN